MGRTERSRLLAPVGRLLLASWVTILVLTGCGKKPEAPPTASPIVTVASVTQKTIPVYLDYVGTTQSVRAVDIRARVKGFIIKRAFVDGADVKKGDLLFVIDPREYQAELERNLAQLAKDQAALAFARKEVERYGPLTEQDLTSKEIFDKVRTSADERAAAVQAERAAIKQARLNLSYCTMRAPFDGRMGRRLVDVGNLVGASEETLLATIVQLDPIYVYFSPSERELPQILTQQQQQGELQVTVILPDGKIHPHPGRVDFVDNVVETSTATITMRAVVPNPEKMLLPGQYARVRLLLTTRPDALLVPEAAVGEDQEGSYVFVVGPDNKVERRNVIKGGTYQGRQVIDKGVKPGERVIVKGMQMVRPGIEVKPESAAAPDAPKPEKETR